MSFVSAIFTLKPIIDVLYKDVTQYVEEIERLHEKIRVLEADNEMLREVNTKTIKIEDVVEEVPPTTKLRVKPKVAPRKISQIDDAVFAKEAETFMEPVNMIVENTDKVVTVVNEEKTRKEYQKEYQRQYRKLKKDKQQGDQ